MKPRIYHHAGKILPSWAYSWCDGYRESDKHGSAIKTKKRCQAEARNDGVQAIFHRDGKPESEK